MKVAQVAPLFLRIPTGRYGGVERVVLGACREGALERFSSERMVADYERAYETVVDGERVAS